MTSEMRSTGTVDLVATLDRGVLTLTLNVRKRRTR